MTKEEKRAAKEAKKAEKKTKKYGESIDDQYDEGNQRLSTEDAHRNVVYDLPSVWSQMWQCYMIQMKRFTKQKTMWLLAILLIAIPVIAIGMKVVDVAVIASTDVNINLATYLTLMPLMTMLISCVICGAMLPQEFNERTVYLSLPLPMSRFAFYIGKFLSGLSLAFGVVIGAYGLAAISSMIVVGVNSVSHVAPMFYSMLIALAAVFFYCAFAYMLSANSKRGSSMKPMILLFAAIPAIAIALGFLFNNLELFDAIKWIGYIPCFGSDLALNYLGTTAIGFPISIFGFAQSMFASIVPRLTIGTNAVMVIAISITCGILCLIRGYNIIKRRDM